MGEKILITGGAGFIGSYIARNLIEKGHQPIIFDGFVQYASPLGKDYVDYRPNRFDGIEGDVVVERGNGVHPMVVYDVIVKHKPDRVVHLAALPVASVQNITLNEGLEGSVIATGNFLEQIERLRRHTGHKVKRFLYTSSSMTYGDFQQFPAPESHPKNPKEIYGIVKLMGEEVTKGLGKLYEIPFTIIVPSAVYGPYDMNLRVSQIFVENALSGRKLIVGGEDEKLDFSYVSDVAEGFCLALFSDSAVGETFNITSGHARSLVDYAKILKSFFPDLEYGVVQRDSGKPRRGTLDITKARKLLGFEPKVTLEMGIGEYLKARGVVKDE